MSPFWVRRWTLRRRKGHTHVSPSNSVAKLGSNPMCVKQVDSPTQVFVVTPLLLTRGVDRGQQTSANKCPASDQPGGPEMG